VIYTAPSANVLEENQGALKMGARGKDKLTDDVWMGWVYSVPECEEVRSSRF